MISASIVIVSLAFNELDTDIESITPWVLSKTESTWTIESALIVKLLVTMVLILDELSNKSLTSYVKSRVEPEFKIKSDKLVSVFVSIDNFVLSPNSTATFFKIESLSLPIFNWLSEELLLNVTIKASEDEAALIPFSRVISPKSLNSKLPLLPLK